MRQQMGGLDRSRQGLDTSYSVRLEVQSVDGDGSVDVAHALLRTHQDAAYGHDGQTCSDWVLDYSMVNSSGGWLIDRVANAAGSPTAC